MANENAVDVSKIRNLMLRKKVTYEGKRKVRFEGNKNGRHYRVFVDPNFEARVSEEMRNRLGLHVADEPARRVRS